MLKDYHLRNYNFKLLIFVLFSGIFGTLVINSADSSYLKKQVIGLVICLSGMIILSLINYKFIEKFHLLLYGFNLVLLLAVILFGTAANGAKRWLGSQDVITIQPSEFSKIFLIICAAHYLEKHKDSINTFKTLFGYAVLCALPLVLIKLSVIV